MNPEEAAELELQAHKVLRRERKERGVEKTPEQAVKEMLEAGTPEAWKWDEDGETCVGTVIGGFIGRTKFGDRKVLTLMVDGVPRSVWLTTTALENQVLQLNPQMGDVLGIKRGEKRVSQASGNEYWDFVATKYGAPGGALNWGTAAALNAGEVAEPTEVTYPETQVTQDPTASADVYDPGPDYAGSNWQS